MPYKINYTPENAKRYPQANKPKSSNWSKCIALLLLLVAAFWMRIRGIPDFLIPGDAEITRKAIETMLSNVKTGEPLDNAVFVFCKEILDGAG